MPKLHLVMMPFAALLCSAAFADQDACFKSVTARDYSRTISACLELPRGDRSAMLSALARGNYTHYLGTLDRPTQAFAQLRAQAATGIVDAQYVYGTLYSMVHVVSPENWRQNERGTRTRESYNSAVRAEAAIWIKKAADQGHTLAMLDLADYYVQQSYEDPKIDLSLALEYASRARDDNESLAELTLDKIRRRMSELR